MIDFILIPGYLGEHKAVDNKEITELIQRWQSGQVDCLNQIVSLLSGELHTIASRIMFQQSNHTLQPTALINEAFLKLNNNQQISCTNQKHFLCLCAKVMRQVLVDHARSKLRAKRQVANNVLEAYGNAGNQESLEETLTVDRLLTQLKTFDERASNMLELSYFGGLTHPEIAKELDTSLSTVEREIKAAKAWIRTQH